jgi:carboxyl-terminal processing protease
MNRIFVALLCLVATVAGFAGAKTWSAVEDNKKSAAERARQDFELMRLFADAYEQIDGNYVREVDRRDLVNAAIQGMASHLDQYSTYVAPEDMAKFEQHLEQEFVGIGIHVNAIGGRLEIVSPLPGSPAFRAGLRSGDAIVEIDSKSTNGLTPVEIGKMLAGPTGRPVVVGVRKLGSEMTEQVTIIRELIQLPTVVGMSRGEDQQWKFMLNEDEKIGYVRITHFARNTASELKAALETLNSQQMKALVLDLRSNPGGLMEASIEMADMFLDSGSIVSMKGRAVPEKKWKARPGNTLTSVPLIVLVNRLSASASEVLSACLQDNKRATIVGERSWGKGSVQNVVPMESGRSALKLTTASYFRPSGVNIHRFPDSKKEDDWGVKPDEGHLVELNKEQWQEWVKAREMVDIHYGRAADSTTPPYADAQLEHATSYLLSQLKTVTETAAPATP